MKTKLNKFLIAFIIGFSLEWILSNFWTYNVPMKAIFGIPLPIVFVWTLALPLSYSLRDKIFDKKNLFKDTIYFLVGLNILEYIGGSIIGWRLSIAPNFPALLLFNSFKAPFILLVLYYIIVIEYWKLLDGKPSMLVIR